MSFVTEKWIPALRNPENRQGRGVLMDAAGAMCCLGLAMREAGVPYETQPGSNAVFDGGADTMPKIEQCSGIIGIPRSLANSLAECNDNGATFAQIADFLETGNETVLLTYLDMGRDSSLVGSLVQYVVPS